MLIPNNDIIVPMCLICDQEQRQHIVTNIEWESDQIGALNKTDEFTKTVYRKCHIKQGCYGCI